MFLMLGVPANGRMAYRGPDRGPDLAHKIGFWSQSGKIVDPNVAAKRLYSAWKTKSRASALRVAEKEAVDKLFSVRWRILKAEPCKHSENGFQCVFHDPKGLFDLSIEVDGGASAGYSVTSVSFSSED